MLYSSAHFPNTTLVRSRIAEYSGTSPSLLGYEARKIQNLGTGEFMIEGLLQPRHLLVILVVALFLFGPKKLPELGKGLAEGIRDFKNALKPSSQDSA
jgi:sec-independent protein translocase protein TatA